MKWAAALDGSGAKEKQAFLIMHVGNVAHVECVGNMHGHGWEPRCKAITFENLSN